MFANGLTYQEIGEIRSNSGLTVRNAVYGIHWHSEEAGIQDEAAGSRWWYGRFASGWWMMARRNPFHGVVAGASSFSLLSLKLTRTLMVLPSSSSASVWSAGGLPGEPVYAEGRAAQAVEAGSDGENSVADAAGPETFTFEDMLRLLASVVNTRVQLVHTPPSLGFALTRLVGLTLRDVVLSPDEVDGLMAGLLTSGSEPTGATKLDEWLEDSGTVLGKRYISELRRNYR